MFEIDDLKGAFKEAKDKLEELEDKIEEAEQKFTELEDERDDFEAEAKENQKASDAEKKLAVFADPQNWVGNMWRPAVALYEDPIEFAERGRVI